ncbi:MAG: acyl-CoA synthetase [Burkholderiaceae bacterium]|nr:acyl-CoA synthetase [Burkholderiaceae bacterium]
MTSVWPPRDVLGEAAGLPAAGTPAASPDDKSGRPTRPAADWSATPERSNRLALRVMVWIALRLGRRIARVVLHPITLYFLAFTPAARRHSGRYLARVLGRAPTLADRYRHFHAFASTVLDRLYFVRGALHEFDIEVHGADFMDATVAEGRGAFLLGAHLGSFEALHAFGASRPGMRVAMVMYPDNARLIHEVLQSVAPQFQLGIIPIGRPGSTLAIRDWLDGGGLAGLLGDRFPPGDPARAGGVAVPFLGVTARFTDGPLRLAQLLRRRVVFMVALYRGGRRYEVRFEPLADFSERVDDAAERERLVRQAVQTYVARLEALVREAPTNWFNFHDFWNED